MGLEDGAPRLRTEGEGGLAPSLASTPDPAAVCSSIREVWRGASLKNARQKTMETQTQGIRMSAIGLSIAPSRGTAN
jgi:hypothetical protein